MRQQRTTAVGVFDNRAEAQKAVNELRRAGFREDQIGVAYRDGESITGATEHDTGSKVAAGAATGLAAGAGAGALWGIGIAAGLLPAIGPAIAGGTLAAILSSAAAGAAVAGLAGALIGLGIPEEEAEYYETEFRAGRTIVTVRTDDRYDEACSILQRFRGYDYSSRSTATQARHEGSKVVQAREEELHVRKEPVQTGEVRVHKEVHTEHRTIDVPVKKEEIVVERHAVSGRHASATGIGDKEEIRIPVREEQVHVEKRPVVKEEVTVGKRQVQDTEKVSGTVKKEEIKVEKEGNVDVKHKRR